MRQDEFSITIGGENDIPKLPDGPPIFKIHRTDIKSWNDMLYLSPYVRAQTVRRERAEGYRIGLAVARSLSIPVKAVPDPKAKSVRASYVERLVSPIHDGKLFCFANVWRQYQKSDHDKALRKHDIYNPCIKALIDGLTDAGLWADDDERFHRAVLYHNAGLNSTPKAEVSFYAM